MILSPTRELAAQITASFKVYAKRTSLRHAEVYGGVSQRPQVNKLKQGVDILVATPGRLIDLINQGHIDLSTVETFVLDEADQMLDMGFIPDIRRIAKQLPSPRQTLMFSATMPPKIKKLADSLLTNPVRIEIAPAATPAERVEQSIYRIAKSQKSELLKQLLENTAFNRLLVFTRTKYGADKVARQINRVGFDAAAIHGNKTQANRKRTLDRFRSGQTPILVATDVAARGIDIDDVSHVINYDLPNDPETYVHRIGRTGRAGASGIAISFCSPDESSYLRSIERLTKVSLQVLEHEILDTSDAPLNSQSDPATNTTKKSNNPTRRPKSKTKPRSQNQQSRNNSDSRRRRSKTTNASSKKSFTKKKTKGQSSRRKQSNTENTGSNNAASKSKKTRKPKSGGQNLIQSPAISLAPNQAQTRHQNPKPVAAKPITPKRNAGRKLTSVSALPQAICRHMILRVL